MKQVTSEWSDAYSPTVVWVHPDSLPDEVPEGSIIKSTGYLVKELEHGIWLAMCLSPDGRVGQVFYIPNRMIINKENS